MVTPYVTPEVIKSAPTGISWTSIPWRNATTAEQLAEQTNICHRATAMIDGYCHQPLRATVDTETFIGPRSGRMRVLDNGTVRLVTSRRPVTRVVSGQISPARAFPQQWQTIPADQFRPEDPPLGVYGTSAPSSSGDGGQSILMAPGLVGACDAPGWWELRLVYVNGWPHGGLTASVAAGVHALPVDDITGWVGAYGTVHDVANQESISVTDVTPTVPGAITGPGMLSLAAATTVSHDAGTMVTALPGTVVQAGILMCVAQALTRGATATTVQSQPGSASGGGRGPEEFLAEAEMMINQFQRVG